MKPVGVCPACEQHVEFDSVVTAAGIAYKCCNCWHHMDAVEMGRLKRLQQELELLDQKRRELLDQHRGGNHAAPAKNR